jgi:hypothetical protein
MPDCLAGSRLWRNFRRAVLALWCVAAPKVVVELFAAGS